MANEVDRSGRFRGRITNYYLDEADSGAEAIAITVAFDQIYHEGDWYDWTESNQEALGRIWVVKKDGKLNERQVRALIDHAGWDGSFTSVAQGEWQPTPCQVVVEEDAYRDQVRYRIAWVNAYDQAVGGGGNLSPDKVAALQAKHGAALRALAGTAKANAAPVPIEKPTRPAAPSAPTPPEPPEKLPPRGEKLSDEQLNDIPF